MKLVFEYAERNCLLTLEQYGFHLGGSTEDQLQMMYEELTKSLDAGNTLGLILFNNYYIMVLLDKLALLGINGTILIWIQDFLTDQVMNVVVAHTQCDTLLPVVYHKGLCWDHYCFCCILTSWLMK